MDVNAVQATNAVSAQLNLDVQNANVQQQISRLPLNQILLGSVAGNDKNGNLIIRLSGSDLLLSSPIALAKGAQVALKVENVSGSIMVELLSVDGKLPASQPQKILNQSQQQTQDLDQPLLNNPQNNSQTSALRVISVLPQNTAKVAEPINFPPNTSIIADIVELSSPSSSPLSAIVIAPGPEIIQAVRSKLAAADSDEPSSLENTLPDEIAPGTNLKVKITSTDSPLQSPSQQKITADNRVLGKQDWMAAEDKQPEDLQAKLQNFTPQLNGAGNGNLSLSGMVLHAEQNGEVLLQTALGKVLVNAGIKYSNLEKGAVLNLEISEITPPDNSADISDDSPLANLTKQWPALQALDDKANGSPLLSKLAGVDDSQFAGRLNDFVNAVKSGDIRQWLGNNYYDALAASDDGKDIISKLKTDFSTLRNNLATPDQNGWQTTLFPIFDGNQLHQARLHVKYLPDEDNNPSPAAGTRFLVEIDTSQFGEIQMDGLVRANMARHFDLMIRTHDPLDVMIKQEIHQIFTDAGEVTGLKGNIEFSVTREFPTNILGQQREQNISAKIDHNGIEA